MNKLLTFIVVVSFSCSCYCILQCLNENGDPVDWFVLYKLPRIKFHPNYKIAQGIAYLYITSETVKQGWKFADYSITDSKSIPGRTLSLIYTTENNNVKDIFWLFYNDAPSNQNVTFTGGHTKGIVIGDQEGGFWIIHSVPKFPITDSSSYEYPKTGTMYGQSFLCISMTNENLNDVGNQIMINCANAFNSSFTRDLEITYPALVEAANKTRRDIKMKKTILNSLKLVPFISFAKSDKFNADLYSTWVAQVLLSELYVESWLHADKLPSDCNETYPVHNVERISVDDFRCKFINMQDHSKYAVSAEKNKPWVCIGDINRASTQYIRGGGTVCIQNHDLWMAYRKIINAVEQCPKIRS